MMKHEKKRMAEETRGLGFGHNPLQPSHISHQSLESRGRAHKIGRLPDGCGREGGQRPLQGTQSLRLPMKRKLSWWCGEKVAVVLNDIEVVG